ncbi:MAG: Flp family type IVb pilin [Acidobacteria bacterium]|nr:Flp family type IVb pilin [Acidobacteriota bacterium]
MRPLIKTFVRIRIWNEDKGQDFVEYALLGGFISVAVAATFPPFAGSITNIFSRVASFLQRA